ncbi:hypothetical protein NDU88_006169 [Pleurodeles waltl]|uniref:Uncharacterized protein n=1 Tax=Pleurodeles waltl TaxID=8319 RepID=A0AAV7N294_PLEWA|nr:hypothetical protein NDU88_006169 [Pleurodeles waltl]
MVTAADSPLPWLGEPSRVLVLPVLAAPGPVGAFGGPAAQSWTGGSACTWPAAAGGAPLRGRLLVPSEACEGGGTAGRVLVAAGSGVLLLRAGLAVRSDHGPLPRGEWRLSALGASGSGSPARRGAWTAPWRPVSSVEDAGWGGSPGSVCCAGLRRCNGGLDTALVFRLGDPLGLTCGCAWEEGLLGGSIAGWMGPGSHLGAIWEPAVPI